MAKYLLLSGVLAAAASLLMNIYAPSMPLWGHILVGAIIGFIVAVLSED